MAGVQKITEEILKEAGAQADSILAEARSKAENITEEAKTVADRIMADSARETQRIAAEQEERTQSSAQMRQRQAILSAKQEVIDRVIAGAYDRLATQDSAEYFRMIEALLRKNIHTGEGELLLSAEDLKRLPENFKETAGEIAAAAGGSLKICAEPAAIANGFILRYGGVEENCSLDALFSQARETLRDKVASILW